MPFRNLHKDTELAKAVSLAMEAGSMSIPLMRSLLTMLEKNAPHANVQVVKCYDLKNSQGQTEEFLNYEGKVPLEVLGLIGHKLFDGREKMDKYDTYGIQKVGFEELLAKAGTGELSGKGYEKIYHIVATELGMRMMDEFLVLKGIMVPQERR
ncbi:MAG: hypothetical protein KGH54_02350 [Candidatus Micrarchaeota archaeon]|nr:hypothetical protein [Candidatus Micrarchaeota archaeon]